MVRVCVWGRGRGGWAEEHAQRGARNDAGGRGREGAPAWLWRLHYGGVIEALRLHTVCMQPREACCRQPSVVRCPRVT